MKKLIRILVPILMAAFFIATIGWFLLDYDRDFTRDMLLREARLTDAQGYTGLSAWFYRMAYSHSGNDEAVAIELANQYKAEGNYTKAEVTLAKAINSRPSADLYVALCRTFVEQNKLIDAVNLLNGIADPAVKEAIEARRPAAPAPNYPTGTYSQYISVELSAENCYILYTTNGEYPSTADAPYSQPIKLPVGETVIRSISINQDGLVSPWGMNGYTIGGVVEEIAFGDYAMANEILRLIGKDESEIVFSNELWNITEFTVPEGTTYLDDLRRLTHLESLTLQNYSFRSSDELHSLINLTYLTELKSLDLTGCRFDDISSLALLARLPNLEKLTLSNCNISTIADLADVTTLTYLDLSYNTIRNIESLMGMQKLKELHMQHNALTHLDNLALFELEKLNIAHNSLSTLAPLAACTKLSWLDVSSNPIGAERLRGLESLKLLTTLNADECGLSDVSVLSSCLQLKELSISDNNITDISSLASLLNLEVFDFSRNGVFSLPGWTQSGALRVLQGSYNKINSVYYLSGMQNLTYVSLDYNALTDISPLANCSNLVQVNVYGNQISSVSDLTDHSIIVNYDPTF